MTLRETGAGAGAESGWRDGLEKDEHRESSDESSAESMDVGDDGGENVGIEALSVEEVKGFASGAAELKRRDGSLSETESIEL